MRSILFLAGPAAAEAVVPPFCAREPLPPHLHWLAVARRAAIRGDTRLALAGFDHAIGCDPGLAIAHLGRAVCLSELGQEDAASDALLAALEHAVGQEEVLAQLARMTASRDSRLSISLVRDAVEAKPQLADELASDAAFAGMRDHPLFLQAVGRL